MNGLTGLTIHQILARLTLPSVALAVIVGLVRWRNLPLNLRYLAALVCFELPIEITSWIIAALYGSNLFLMPVYTVGEFTLLSLVYRQTLQSIRFNRLVVWLIISFTAYALFDSLQSSTVLKQFQPSQQVIQSLLILGFVAIYFRKLLNELRVEKLSSEPIFWVSI